MNRKQTKFNIGDIVEFYNNGNIAPESNSLKYIGKYYKIIDKEHIFDIVVYNLNTVIHSQLKFNYNITHHNLRKPSIKKKLELLNDRQ